MFPSRYFPDRYFAPRYFAAIGASAVYDGPYYVATGTYSRVAGDQPLQPTYPPTQAGDLLTLQTYHLAGPTQNSATYSFPSDWELRHLDSQNSSRQWVYTKEATGEESGSISITAAGGSSGSVHQAVIHAFRDADPDNFEGAAVSSGVGTAVADAGVTTTDANRLALQFGAITGNEAPADFSGETGGDWEIASQSGTGNTRLFMQTAEMAESGAIDGGTFTIGSSIWIVRGFALIYREYVPPEPEVVVVPSGGGGGGGWRGRGGAALGVKERRRISKMVDEAFAKLYGPKSPPAEVKEAVVAAVEQDLAPMPALDLEGLARVHKALVDLQAALDAQAEDEAEVLALLNLVH